MRITKQGKRRALEYDFQRTLNLLRDITPASEAALSSGREKVTHLPLHRKKLHSERMGSHQGEKLKMWLG